MLSRRPLPSLWLFLKLIYIGAFASLFLPSSFGGDVVRSTILGKQIKSQFDSAQSLVIGRVFGFMTIQVIFWISMIWFHDYMTPFPLLYFTNVYLYDRFYFRSSVLELSKENFIFEKNIVFPKMGKDS